MTDTPTEQLGPIIDVLKSAQAIWPSMTVNQLAVFFMVARNPNIQQTQIEKELGISNASTSRIMALLSQYGNRDVAALKLFKAEADDKDRRLRVYTLTPKGADLVRNTVKTLAVYDRGN